MKLSLLFSILMSSLLSAACIAAEPSVCKSICAEEKRECRHDAHRKAKLDGSPIVQNEPSRNRDARALGPFQGTPQDAKATAASEFNKRKAEREQACDSKALACAGSCTGAEPASVVLKPKTQQ